jgi:hypothetical protein
MVDRALGQGHHEGVDLAEGHAADQRAAAATDTAAPLFAACMPIYNAAMALGHGDADTAAVYAVLEQLVGGAPAKEPRTPPPSPATRRS